MRFEGRYWTYFKNGLTLLIAVSFALTFAGQFKPKGNRLPEGTTLPQFNLPSINGSGANVTSEQLAGRGVILHFWATWCGACKRGMPVVQKIHERFQDKGLVVLGVTDDNPKAAANYLTQLGFTYPAVWDRRARLAQKFKVRSIPFSVFFDGNGKLLADRTGPLSEDDVAELFPDLLE